MKKAVSAKKLKIDIFIKIGSLCNKIGKAGCTSHFTLVPSAVER